MQCRQGSSKVLSALNARFPSPTTLFLPDMDGTIDLTTPENDRLFDALSAQLVTCPSRTTCDASDDHSAPSSGLLGKRRLKKTESLKENEHTLSGEAQSLAKSDRSSGIVTKPPQPGSAYPTYNYAENVPKPKVIYIKNEEDADEVVSCLNGAVGLDLEWPFTPSRLGGGQEGKVALVQLCDVDIILLIHVSKMKLKLAVTPFSGLKICGRIQDDGMKLFRDYDILASNLVELGALACQVDQNFASTFKRPIVSLAKIVSYCLQKTLDKGPVRTSDWSKDLTPAQMKYASNDVHSGLLVYRSLMKTARSSSTRLIPQRYTTDLAKELKERGHGGATRNPSRGGRRLHRHAYTLWRQGHGLLDICVRLGSQTDPQNVTVVISSIMRALAEDPALPFCVEELISLIMLDKTTVERWAQEGRGLEGAKSLVI
ncbi:ribonuclease H-like domain-containing protein [Russula earlei]|uniref:Ribonuclease H-like domain-containing protein n=1 Tax=Russula earlei TaxID=71964 RepID=A0ACC0UPG4_9AGAM|nr:ribonuclease H-like domain-containing protein [Russula earlei]